MIVSVALVLLAAAAPNMDCGEPLTQSAMNICADRAYRAADDALNEQWRETVAVLKEKDRAGNELPDDDRPGYYDTLLKAQRAWLAFRDAHCRLKGYDARGGSLEAMLVSTCLADLTHSRTRQLRELTINQISNEARGGHDVLQDTYSQSR